MKLTKLLFALSATLLLAGCDVATDLINRIPVAKTISPAQTPEATASAATAAKALAQTTFTDTGSHYQTGSRNAVDFTALAKDAIAKALAGDKQGALAAAHAYVEAAVKTGQVYPLITPAFKEYLDGSRLIPEHAQQVWQQLKPIVEIVATATAKPVFRAFHQFRNPQAEYVGSITQRGLLQAVDQGNLVYSLYREWGQKRAQYTDVFGAKDDIGQLKQMWDQIDPNDLGEKTRRGFIYLAIREALANHPEQRPPKLLRPTHDGDSVVSTLLDLRAGKLGLCEVKFYGEDKDGQASGTSPNLNSINQEVSCDFAKPSAVSRARAENFWQSLELIMQGAESPLAILLDEQFKPQVTGNAPELRHHLPQAIGYEKRATCNSSQFSVSGLSIAQKTGAICYVQPDSDELLRSSRTPFPDLTKISVPHSTQYGITDSSLNDYHLWQVYDQSTEVYPGQNRSVNLTSGYYKQLSLNGASSRVVATKMLSVNVGAAGYVEKLIAASKQVNVYGFVMGASINGHTTIHNGGHILSLVGTSLRDGTGPLNVTMEFGSVADYILGACKATLNGYVGERVAAERIEVLPQARLPHRVHAAKELILHQDPYIFSNSKEDYKFGNDYQKVSQAQYGDYWKGGDGDLVYPFTSVTRVSMDASSDAAKRLQTARYYQRRVRFSSNAGRLVIDVPAGQTYTWTSDLLLKGFKEVVKTGQGTLKLVGLYSKVERDQGSTSSTNSTHSTNKTNESPNLIFRVSEGTAFLEDYDGKNQPIKGSIKLLGYSTEDSEIWLFEGKLRDRKVFHLRDAFDAQYDRVLNQGCK